MCSSLWDEEIDDLLLHGDGVWAHRLRHEAAINAYEGLAGFIDPQMAGAIGMSHSPLNSCIS